jgi:ribose transport system substrate-binding protein
VVQVLKISRVAVLLATVVASVWGLAACGGSGSSGSTSSASTQSGANEGVARAQSELAPALQMPDSIGLTASLKKSPAGKTVDYMECGVTECKEIGTYLSEAAKVLGITVKHVPAGNTPESIGRAFDQAVQDRPDGVVASGVSRVIYEKQLAQLKKLGIPVVSMGTADQPGNGLAQVLLGRATYENNGKYAADWAISDSKGKANVLLLTAPVFDFAKPLTGGFEAAMKHNCPSCQTHVMPVSPDDIGKGVPSQVVSYLQQKPSTNYVIAAFGSLMIGVPQAVKAAGLQGKVNLFSIAPSQADFVATKDGLMKANLSGSELYLGWMTADQIARAMTGQPPTQVVDDAQLPWMHIFTANNENWDLKAWPNWPFIPGFREQFKKLWGKQ